MISVQYRGGGAIVALVESQEGARVSVRSDARGQRDLPGDSDIHTRNKNNEKGEERWFQSMDESSPQSETPVQAMRPPLRPTLSHAIRASPKDDEEDTSTRNGKSLPMSPSMKRFVEAAGTRRDTESRLSISTTNGNGLGMDADDGTPKSNSMGRRGSFLFPIRNPQLDKEMLIQEAKRVERYIRIFEVIYVLAFAVRLSDLYF